MGHRISLNGKVILLTIRHVFAPYAGKIVTHGRRSRSLISCNMYCTTSSSRYRIMPVRMELILKGDLPIGVSRTSVEAWTEPKYFNMNGQAGAPPMTFHERSELAVPDL